MVRAKEKESKSPKRKNGRAKAKKVPKPRGGGRRRDILLGTRSYRNMVKVLSFTEGIGTFTHVGAVIPGRTPVASDDGEKFSIRIAEVDGDDRETGVWEICESIYTHATFEWSRGDVIDNYLNTFARINFGPGPKHISIDNSADKYADQDYIDNADQELSQAIAGLTVQIAGLSSGVAGQVQISDGAGGFDAVDFVSVNNATNVYTIEGVFSAIRGITGIGVVTGNWPITDLAGLIQIDSNVYYGNTYVAAGNNQYTVWQQYVKTRSADGNSYAAVQNGDELGYFVFFGDNTGLQISASWKVSVDGALGSFIPSKQEWMTREAGGAQHTMLLNHLGVLTIDGTPVGGSPGGAFGSVQFNNAGTLGGFGVWSGTVLTFPGSGRISVPTQSSGPYNEAFGKDALYSITTGDRNTGLGIQAGYSLTSGRSNTLVGSSAGYFITDGENNVFIGGSAGASAVHTFRSVVIGSAAAPDMTDADANVIIGCGTGARITTGSENVIIGMLAGASITTGSRIVVVGTSALGLCTSGTQNTAVGVFCGASVTTGSFNSLFGYSAGIYLTTGNFNTFLGSSAGSSITTGDCNICIGVASGEGLPGNASNWFTCGGTYREITNVNFGNGVYNITPIGFTLIGTGGLGSNVVGATVKIAPGPSTGNATPGVVALQGTAVGSSGTTPQTLSDVLIVSHSLLLTIANGANVAVGTSTGTKWGTATDQKQAWWNANPVVQQILATGAGHTVDDIITLLQLLGICKQS